MATPALAEHFAEVTDSEQVPALLAHARERGWPLYVLGGGSNTVLRGNLPGLVLQVAMKGIHARPVFAGVQVTAAAGESWQSLVDYCVAAGYWGVENLNLIPGTVGAAPIQNIGAYGVELADRFVSLSALRVRDGTLCQFNRDDCQFAYRQSRFKNTDERYLITEVTLQLSVAPQPVLSYPGLRDALSLSDGADPRDTLTPASVAQAVAALRRAKLPDPAHVPNSGSFFHNPVIEAEQADRLQAEHPALIRYPLADGRVKLAAGWLIEQAGFKGVARQGVGVHSGQALVLVNPGRKPGAEVLALAQEVAEGVFQKFGVRLTIEPQILP